MRIPKDLEDRQISRVNDSLHFNSIIPRMEAVIVNSLPRGHRHCVALAIMIVSVCLFSVFCGCDPSDMDANLDSTSADNAGSIAPLDPSSGSHTPLVGRQAIIVGSFNIQTFGRGKMSKSEVVSVLVDIARRFDILAIQELRDVQQETIPEFLRLINQNGSHYRAAISQRIGYTDVASNKRFEEQLVYLYDSDQVEKSVSPMSPKTAMRSCIALPTWPISAAALTLANKHFRAF